MAGVRVGPIGDVWFSRTETGAAQRKLQDKLRDIAIAPEDFGAVGDYYTASGSVNPSPTDDTVAMQAAIDATKGNGALLISRAYKCTALLQVSGILGVASPLAPALYSKASLGRVRPYAIVNTTTNVFRTNPSSSQCGIHMRGVTFLGATTTKMFDTTGQTPIADYFNATASGCLFKGFGDRMIDGSLGSWLWKFDNCDFQSQGYLAVYLYQPHNAVFEKNGFYYRNKQDLYSLGGQSFTWRNNSCDFDVGYKEVGLEFDSPQNLIYEGCYHEEYEQGLPIVNAGRGTDVVKITVDHYSPNCVQSIRNNYYAAADVQRLFTVKRDPAEEALFTTCQLKIEDNSINGLGGDYLYHDHTGAGTLTMPRPRMQAAQSTAYTVSDPNGSLRFSGPNVSTVLRYALVTPAHNSYVVAAGTLTTTRDDKNYTAHANGWNLTSQGTEVTITYSWSNSTAADFWVEVAASGVNGFTTVPLRQTGTKGGGSFRAVIANGVSSLLTVRLVQFTGTATICDTAQVIVELKGYQRG